jgi:hypothetical protein
MADRVYGVDERPMRVSAIGVAVFEPEWTALQNAADENPFIHAAVELLKSTVGLGQALATLSSAQPHPINAAIRCGLLVRASKLCLDLLADTCHGRGRLQIGLMRQVTETLANLAYLCGDDEQGTRHLAFLRESLISEREFLKVIERRQAGAGGPELAIEARMRRSIQNTARAAGIDLDNIPGRRQINWPSALERIELAFGPTAYPSYRVGSDALHGGWCDLIRNHLNEVNGGFEPEFRAVAQRPQSLLAATIQLSTVAITYLQTRSQQEHNFLEQCLRAVLGFALRTDDIHENWLTPAS